MQDELYEPMACILHTGTLESGHYRALLKVSYASRCQWLLCDDDHPVTVLEDPEIQGAIGREITMVWLCHRSMLSIPRMQERPIGQPHGTLNAVLHMLRNVC